MAVAVILLLMKFVRECRRAAPALAVAVCLMIACGHSDVRTNDGAAAPDGGAGGSAEVGAPSGPDRAPDSALSAPGDASAPASNLDGSWLTFSPTALAVVAPPPSVTAPSNVGMELSFYATLTRTFADPVNVAIIDLDGGTSDKVELSKLSATQYHAKLWSNVALSPGTHTGTLEVRICFDDPLVCSKPLPGSPWHVPYTILVMDDGAYTIGTQWTKANRGVSFDSAGLAVMGSTLVALAFAPSAGLETWNSLDEGVTWTRVASGLAPRTRSFALAGDEQTLFLSGGQLVDSQNVPLGTYPRQLWKFDGSAWTLVTDSAQFPGRAGHAMLLFQGELYIFGGNNDTGFLSDAWKSSDGGATWKQLPDLPAGIYRTACASTWQKGFVLVSGANTPCPTASCQGSAAMWTSTDGISWQPQPGYSQLYHVVATSCTVLGDRLYVVGEGGADVGIAYFMVSSADLLTWQYEPTPLGAPGSPGMPALDGSLFLSLGSGASDRTIVRTTPVPTR